MYQDPDRDPCHPSARAAKRSLVKDVWIGAGLLMLSVGETALIAIIALVCTCLSFMILDETA